MALVIGISGIELESYERTQLKRADVAGVILFARNFQTRSQIIQLIAQIKKTRASLLVFVDQEGGPVQRFKDGFAKLPALSKIGALYESNPLQARRAARLHAQVMVSDMLRIGIDMSFAPVADLLRGNRAIGIRAFHEDASITANLSLAYVKAMQASRMVATLKHFPGHGSVLEDTHFEIAKDPRELAELMENDLLPFAKCAKVAGAVMMAHVVYPAVDPLAAGYSATWIKSVLRKQFGFSGAVFSDDVGMEGGADVGSVPDRVKLHYEAGCDFVLTCTPAATQLALAGGTTRKVSTTICSRLRAPVLDLTSKRALTTQSRRLDALNDLLA
jgi:beta-N-acetylhexosaminidase